ncbi:5'-AMP-activated protein kinase, catalytic alpha subunit [Angomonas deanei]|nr:5'-AMP-activated protein kinase, catalytic alpha subunit [Angomonas deanei]|eukprot:EPY32598.1 5'-AMP-activated protein kinase, catalytic alpha subunit [Angomonas deanei]
MYLIMEYIEGGELYDYIVQRGRVPEKEGRYIFQQIVCAIEYCHHFRVVHRDLKPENILLGPGLQVKLIDFGLSNIMKDGDFLTTSCGSPNYAAPEVISGKLYFGPEVDVWSCGVILYALLCGCLPFDEDSIPVLFTKIKKGKYSIPSSMQESPKQLIQQILVVDPLIRLTIPQIRDNAWFNVNLPMRLTYNESLFTSQEDRINPVLVTDTAKRLGIHEKEVRQQLEMGGGPAYVAYNILLDVSRRKGISIEVRELGVLGMSSPLMAQEEQPSFVPKAMERELNMGLMLTQSPAMEALLDHNDATMNKNTYNSGSFIPASAQDGRTSQITLADSPTGGSFRMTSKPFSSGSVSSNSRRALSSGVQLGASLQEPRVGSVARKYNMYTAEEEEFIVHNNVGWRVGVMTDLHGEKVLRALYGVMKEFNMEWKVLAPFRLAVRTTPETWNVMEELSRGPKQTPLSSASNDDDGEEYVKPTSRVRFNVHVLRIHERHEKGYIVDFSIVQNTILGFDILLHLTDKLLRQIG